MSAVRVPSLFARMHPTRHVTTALIVVAAGIGAWWTTDFVRTGEVTADPDYRLEISGSSSAPAHLTVFFGDGEHFRPGDSATAAQTMGSEAKRFHLPLPSLRFRALRLDPMDVPGTATLADLRIVDDADNVIREIPVQELKPLSQIAGIERGEHQIRVTTTPGGNDPQLLLLFEPSLDLRSKTAADRVRWLLPFLAFAAWFGILLALRHWWRARAAQVSKEVLTSRPRLPWRWKSAFAGATLIVFVGCLIFSDATSDPGERQVFALDVEMSVSDAGVAQVFFDRGNGFIESDSAALPLVAGRMTTYRFPLPQGTYRGFRLDYLNGSGAADIQTMRVVSTAGRGNVATFDPTTLQPNAHIAGLEKRPSGVYVETSENGFDPFLVLPLDSALVLKVSPWADSLALIGPALMLIAILTAAVVGVDHLLLRSERVAQWVRQLRATAVSHPRQLLGAVAVGATLLSCYPVAFLGKSLSSPFFGVSTLYAGPPFVAGASTTPIENARDTRIENPRNSDVGALAWQHLPYSVIQHRALVRDHELPLWNRYNSGGTSLVGQGQSMLGDPFHVPVILAGGATWAWDLKFLVARFLFCCGSGWLVWAATRHFGVSALMTVSAAFFGFFAFRATHPAYLSFSYAPWIAVAWFQIARTQQLAGAGRWIALLWLANWCEVTSGTVKEASMLTISLNLTGALAWLLTTQPFRLRWRIGVLQGLLAIAFLLISAPWWQTFAHALASGWNAYETPHAGRIPVSWLPGLFDGMLYSELLAHRIVFSPSANFVVLLGVLWWLARLHVAARDRTILGFVVGAFVALSIAFAVPWLPTRWILAVPGLRNVGHTHNVFSCVALIALLVPAGAGLAMAFERLRTRHWWRDLAIVAGLAVAMFAFYFRSAFTIWENARTKSDGSTTHGYFLLTLVMMTVGCGGLLLAVAWRQHKGSWGPASLLAVGAALLPVFARHGEQVTLSHDDFFLSPPARVRIQTRSSAVAWMQHHLTEPARVFGLNTNLFSGVQGIYDLENITGADAIEKRAYRELVQAAGLVAAGQWMFEWRPSELGDKRRILDMLGARYYADAAGARVPWPWVKQVADLDLRIFASDSAWPRAFFTDRVTTYGDVPDFLRLVQEGDGAPFAARLAGDPALPALTSAEGESPRVIAASAYRLTTQSTRFVVDAPGSGVVVLMEGWSPGHSQVRINGQPATVLRLNHAFQGVAIPGAGTFTIEFTYWPEWMTGALTLSALGILVGFGAVCFWMRTARRPQAH